MDRIAESQSRLGSADSREASNPGASACGPNWPTGTQTTETESEASMLLENVVREALQCSLEKTRGNRGQAAILLGVSRSTLYRMLERYDILDLEFDGTNCLPAREIQP
jgi:transcriptional regulator of acetoin/glycerol metabolism